MRSNDIWTDRPACNPGTRVRVVLRDVEATGVVPYAGTQLNVPVKLDGTGQVVWVPKELIYSP